MITNNITRRIVNEGIKTLSVSSEEESLDTLPEKVRERPKCET